MTTVIIAVVAVVTAVFASMIVAVPDYRRCRDVAAFVVLVAILDISVLLVAVILIVALYLLFTQV